MPDELDGQGNTPASESLRRFHVNVLAEAHAHGDEWTPVIVVRFDTIYGEERHSATLASVDTADHALRHALKFLAAAITEHKEAPAGAE